MDLDNVNLYKYTKSQCNICPVLGYTQIINLTKFQVVENVHRTTHQIHKFDIFAEPRIQRILDYFLHTGRVRRHLHPQKNPIFSKLKIPILKFSKTALHICIAIVTLERFHRFIDKTIRLN